MKQFDTNGDRLRRQQAVLAHLKFYSGKLDGIWGPASIKAKKAFETSGTFTGGLPSQGLPFNPNAQLPNILFRDPTNGLICHPTLDKEKLEELMRNRGVTSETKVEPAKVVEAPKQEQAKESAPRQEQRPEQNAQQHSKKQKHRHSNQQG